jgi:hypothetical protein
VRDDANRRLAIIEKGFHQIKLEAEDNEKAMNCMQIAFAAMNIDESN